MNIFGRAASLIVAVLVIFTSFVGLGGLSEVQAYNDYETCKKQHDDAKKPGSTAPGVIRLNTDVPFVGRCLIKRTDGEESNLVNGVPKLLQSLIRIAMTVVVVTGFLGILVGGFMITGAGAFGTAETGKKIIIGVIVGLILLGASGIILSLVNPDFFTTT